MHIPGDSKCLKFLYFNAQSCGNKKIEMNNLIVETNADLVFITETRIPRDDTVKLTEMIPRTVMIFCSNIMCLDQEEMLLSYTVFPLTFPSLPAQPFLLLKYAA